MIVIKVWLHKSYYTTITINDELFCLPEEMHYMSYREPIGIAHKFDLVPLTNKRYKCLKVNAYFLYIFIKECIISHIYRKKVDKHILKLCDTDNEGIVFLKLDLQEPEKEILDYAWNEKLLKLIWTRIEIENAFSWLSTLGGAYSALGDYFQNCAEEAGRISLRQYRLSKMLGDDGLAARSRLYLALAYSQKGKLKHSRHMVRKIASYGRESKDKRLVKMCQGVWAKLKYLREIKNITKFNINLGNGDNNEITKLVK